MNCSKSEKRVKALYKTHKFHVGILNTAGLMSIIQGFFSQH